MTILFENSDSLWIALQQTGGLSAQAFIEHVSDAVVAAPRSLPYSLSLIIIYHMQLLLFIRSHSLLNDANQLAVFGVGSGGTTLLHATQGCLPSLHSETAQNTPLEALGDDSASALLTRLKEAAQTSTTIDDDDGSSLPIAWSSVLLRSLCFIHKLQTSTAANNQPPLQSRILCISSSPDDPGQYLATMNAIFAAQRSKVVIDACVLGNHHSSFMQQATHLTGGTYLKPTQPDALVQYLLASFLKISFFLK